MGVDKLILVVGLRPVLQRQTSRPSTVRTGSTRKSCSLSERMKPSAIPLPSEARTNLRSTRSEGRQSPAESHRS